MRAPASFNNFWGVPLTLCNAGSQSHAWVVEMGINQTGEIARLSEFTRPTVALVVNVQPVHLEKLGSLEAIRREKVSIAQGLPRDGVLVLPADVEAPEWNGEIVRFGEPREVRAMNHSFAQGESWDVSREGRRQEDRVRPDARRAASPAERARGAGLDPCRRTR